MPKPGLRLESEAEPRSATLWKPVTAALLSMVFAGLGHFLLQAYARGGVLLAAGALIFSLTAYWPPATALNIMLFVFAAFDAFSIGRRGFGIV
ncbi:hypothetical protein [Candidatus Manganitrophus noduliformans]|uniref:Uncharacterized protein n=1 Tax=Candidatus Manganitrophus noduliformans TaxID=2606439 RepID=A0A7X6DMW7_9BACT|nr:hypothetical protein [Candidatus Manganitrophus noduliformans]NKE70042.1 hypothetical protein [Candidatus Manganitrophus noduliformans]